MSQTRTHGIPAYMRDLVLERLREPKERVTGTTGANTVFLLVMLWTQIGLSDTLGYIEVT